MENGVSEEVGSTCDEPECFKITGKKQKELEPVFDAEQIEQFFQLKQDVIINRQKEIFLHFESVETKFESLAGCISRLTEQNQQLVQENKSLQQQLVNAKDEQQVLQNRISMDNIMTFRSAQSFDESTWLKDFPEQGDNKLNLSQLIGVKSMEIPSSCNGSFSNQSENVQEDSQTHQLKDPHLYQLGKGGIKEVAIKKYIQSLQKEVKSQKDALEELRQQNEALTIQLQLKTALLNKIDVADICEEDVVDLIKLKTEQDSSNISSELASLQHDRARLEIMLRQCIQTIITMFPNEYDIKNLDDNIDEYEAIVANITKQSVRISRDSGVSQQIPNQNGSFELKRMGLLQDKLAASERDKLDIQKQYLRTMEINEKLNQIINGQIHDLQPTKSDNKVSGSTNDEILTLKQQNHKLMYFCTQLQDSLRALSLKTSIESQASMKEYLEANTRMRSQIDKLTVDLHKCRQKYLDAITTKLASKQTQALQQTPSVVQLKQACSVEVSDEENCFQTTVPQLMSQIAVKEQRISYLEDQLDKLQEKKATRELIQIKEQFTLDSYKKKIVSYEDKIQRLQDIIAKQKETFQKKLLNEAKLSNNTLQEVMAQNSEKQNTILELVESSRQKDIAIRRLETKLKAFECKTQKIKTEKKILSQKQKQTSQENEKLATELLEQQKTAQSVQFKVLQPTKHSKEGEREKLLERQVNEARNANILIQKQVAQYQQLLDSHTSQLKTIKKSVMTFCNWFSGATNSFCVVVQKKAASESLQISFQGDLCNEKLAKTIDFIRLQRNTIIRQQIELKQVQHLQQVIRAQELKIKEEQTYSEPPNIPQTPANVFGIYETIVEENKRLMEENHKQFKLIAQQNDENARVKNQLYLLMGRPCQQ